MQTTTKINADELEFLRRTTLAGYFKTAHGDKDFPVSTIGINLQELRENAFQPGQYLHKVELDQIIICAPLGMHGSNLSEARLSNLNMFDRKRPLSLFFSNLRGITINHCDMRGVDIVGADLQGARIVASNIEISSFFRAKNWETVAGDTENTFWYTPSISQGRSRYSAVPVKVDGIHFNKPKERWHGSRKIVTKAPESDGLQLFSKNNSFLRGVYARAARGEEVTIHIAQFSDARLKEWKVPEALREKIAEYRADYVIG